jgi:hypothetical protein
MGRLLKRISRVRPHNAPSISALTVKTFLNKHGAVQISHPPYSPDLTQAVFFFFPTVKTALKGKRFQDWTLFLRRPLLTVFKNFLNDATNYSSRRRLLWIEIKQILITLYSLFIFSHQSQNFIAWPHNRVFAPSCFLNSEYSRRLCGNVSLFNKEHFDGCKGELRNIIGWAYLGSKLFITMTKVQKMKDIKRKIPIFHYMKTEDYFCEQDSFFLKSK